MSDAITERQSAAPNYSLRARSSWSPGLRMGVKTRGHARTGEGPKVDLVRFECSGSINTVAGFSHVEFVTGPTEDGAIQVRDPERVLGRYVSHFRAQRGDDQLSSALGEFILTPDRLIGYASLGTFRDEPFSEERSGHAVAIAGPLDEITKIGLRTKRKLLGGTKGKEIVVQFGADDDDHLLFLDPQGKVLSTLIAQVRDSRLLADEIADRAAVLKGSVRPAWASGGDDFLQIAFPQSLNQGSGAAGAATGVPATPPGWYPDPNLPSQYRWWDGTRWTDQTAPMG